MRVLTKPSTAQIVFELPPEVVHGVEFRTLAWQPEQGDVQPGR